MNEILLVEDDITYSRIIKNFLEKNGFTVKSATKISEASIYLQEKSKLPNLVITDFRLPDGTGLEVLDKTKKLSEEIPVILITNYSDIRIAVKAMKMGAFEYITKPINPDELLLTVKEALDQPGKLPKKTSKSTKEEELDYIIGESEDSQKLEKHISLVAPTDLSVIVLGETGTGKEYISKRIHQKSQRNKGPFVAIDCGALSKDLAGSEFFGHVKGAFTGALENRTGQFEAANGGTVFLDEVGNLSYDIQVKLLRAIQERKIRKVGGDKEIPIDIRIISATNDDLQDHTKSDSFREDLYHRLNEFSIKALPLRERKEDLMLFAEQFLNTSNQNLQKQVKGFSPEVKAVFMEYPWPGNLRELKNIIRRAVLLCQEDYIPLSVLPGELTDRIQIDYNDEEPSDLKNSLMQQEKEMIQKTMIDVKFNKSKAAKILGMDRKTLYNKLSKYGLE